MGQLFSTFEFDHPRTDETRVIGRRSYLWASLFGPFYVLTHGFPLSAALMIPISATIFIVAFIFVVLVDGFFGSIAISISAIVLAPIAALTAQGLATIELLRWTYLRRGWRGGYY